MRNSIANARRTVGHWHEDEFTTRRGDPSTFEEVYTSVQRLFPRPVWALMRVRAVAWIVGKICYLLKRERDLERKLSESASAHRRDLFFGSVREMIIAQRHCPLRALTESDVERTYLDEAGNRFVIFYGELLRVILRGVDLDDSYEFDLDTNGVFVTYDEDADTEQRFNDLMRAVRKQDTIVTLTKDTENPDSGPGEPTA